MSEKVKEVLQPRNIELGYLSKCATDLCQPVDSLVIKKKLRRLGGEYGTKIEWRRLTTRRGRILNKALVSSRTPIRSFSSSFHPRQ